MRNALLIVLSGFFLFLSSEPLYSQSWSAGDYEDVVEYLKTKGVSESDSRRLLSDSRLEFYPNIMDRFEVSPDTSGVSYNIYDQFKTSRSIRRGKNFLRQNDSLLTRAENNFGIPKEIFVAFLRVESNFGNHTGNYQAFGVFASIIRYSNDQSRVDWAKSELAALISLSGSLGEDPLTINSSYAGAFGLPQFMPSSFLEFAMDGDGDGRVDLFSLEDAVWSMGFYLVSHGWHQDRRAAVFAYNHSNDFVDCILEYARLIR